MLHLVFLLWVGLLHESRAVVRQVGEAPPALLQSCSLDFQVNDEGVPPGDVAWRCSGTVIGTHTLLGAAHCIETLSRYHEVNLNVRCVGGQDVWIVERPVMHPSYLEAFPTGSQCEKNAENWNELNTSDVEPTLELLQLNSECTVGHDLMLIDTGLGFADFSKGLRRVKDQKELESITKQGSGWDCSMHGFGDHGRIWKGPNMELLFEPTLDWFASTANILGWASVSPQNKVLLSLNSLDSKHLNIAGDGDSGGSLICRKPGKDAVLLGTISSSGLKNSFFVNVAHPSNSSWIDEEMLEIESRYPPVPVK